MVSVEFILNCLTNNSSNVLAAILPQLNACKLQSHKFELNLLEYLVRARKVLLTTSADFDCLWYQVDSNSAATKADAIIKFRNGQRACKGCRLLRTSDEHGSRRLRRRVQEKVNSRLRRQEKTQVVSLPVIYIEATHKESAMSRAKKSTCIWSRLNSKSQTIQVLSLKQVLKTGNHKPNRCIETASMNLKLLNKF